MPTPYRSITYSPSLDIFVIDGTMFAKEDIIGPWSDNLKQVARSFFTQEQLDLQDAEKEVEKICNDIHNQYLKDENDAKEEVENFLRGDLI